MELGLGNTLLPGDPRLIDHIVAEVKSQGIFDQFRKECIADVDTKPAYQNLNARVESSVNSFLNKQKWRADLNKNQLRETLRKHIHDAPYLEVGVDRIVDQVVNPKIYSVFMPKIEDVVYKYLGIERPKPQRNGACDLKDLLPTDLDPVSPESDRGSIKDESMEFVGEDEKKIVNGDEEKPSVSNIENKPLDEAASPVRKETIEIEIEKDCEAMDSPVKAALNTSFKSDDAAKTEEEEEESPDFEPIDMHLNESNMSNDSHLSGISELTSHRSGSPDFATDFARDNFDCSNQDSQLSKVSSNSRLSIVTDVGSSNHGSTPKSDAKEDSKSSKDNFKAVKEFESNKDSKFNFDVAKIKDTSKMSSSSKESSRDATDYKDSKPKDESRSKSSKVKHESRSSRGKERDSRRRHSSKRRHRSRSKDKIESDSQESRDYYQKPKEIKIDKKEDTSDEITDLKDRYKEKIRELREKIELTEKGKLGKINLDLSKDRKDSISSKDKEESKKSSHKSSSRSSSHHSKSSRNSESKESRDKSSSRHEERRHSNGKGESKWSSKSRRDSKSDSRSSDRSKDKKRRDEKKSKSTDDHSSLRKNLNDRRSSDRDGSDGSSSKYSHKASFGTSSTKFGPTSELTKDSKEQHSSGETESVHDSLQATFKGGDGLLKKVDPGSSEICLPLKKRRLLSEESQGESPPKKKRSSEKKALKRKLEQLDAFKCDSDVASVPDEERVQIVEYADEEYDQPYPDKELVLSLEETKKIILDAEPVAAPQPGLSEMEQSILSELMADHKKTETDVEPSPPKLSEMEQSILSEMMADHKKAETPVEPVAPPQQPNLSEMEQSIHRSLSEIMADHKSSDTDVEPVRVSTVMDSSSLLEALTDDSSTDKEALTATNTEEGASNSQENEVEKLDAKIEKGENSMDTSDQSKDSEVKVVNVGSEENKETSECNKEAKGKGDLSIENQLEQFETFDDGVEDNVVEKPEIQENAEKDVPENKKSIEPEKEQNTEVSEVQDCTEKVSEIEESNKIQTKQSIEVSETQETIEKVVPEIEKSDVTEKQESIETDESRFDEITIVDVEPDTKNTDDTEEDREQQADFDEFNEDDTLIIDEDVDEKEKDDVELPEVTENPTESEKIVESSETKSSDDIEIIEIKDSAADKLDNSTEKLSEPECSDKSSGKPSEFTEEAKEEIKNQLINELAKLDENDSDDDKQEDEIKESTFDECTSNKDDAPIEVIKLDDSPAKSTKLDSDDDSDIDIVEIKDDDEVFKLGDCDPEEKLEEFDPLAEDSLDVEKPEEVTVIENVDQDSLDAEKPDEAVGDPLAISEKITDSPIPKCLDGAHCSADSPDDEDCHYFDSDNQKYLSFKKYLDQLEADAAKVIEEKVESPLEEILPVVEPVEPAAATVSAPIKRKHSPSPIVENIIKDNNNDGSTTTKEPIAVEVSNQEIPVEEPVVVVKKRKVGRMKKSSSSGSVTSSTSQPDQPQDKEQQQPQAAMVNGENFMMPLSPESDISVSSDKNQGGNAKEEKRGQRSSQRYSSDDLYKPRPLFSQSSRRTTRRYHQA